MLVWLSVWSEVQIVCLHMLQLILTSFKFRLLLSYWLTQVVLEKEAVKRSSC